MMKLTNLYLLVFILCLLTACRQDVPTQSVSETTAFPKSHLSPDERFGELFRDVQLAPVFPDSKTFVDCTPLHPTDEILRKYEAQKNEPDFDLSTFVKSNFELPHQYSTDFESNTSRSVAEHINALWPVLTRQPDSVTVGSLLPLPKSYIVPGGRFGEIYYWDSYFTILGLQSAGRDDMVENMADNFAHLIQTYGHIPNGNRSYYLTRSQPPYFSLIVEVLRQMKGEEVLKKYLPALEKEYAFWMDGMEQLTAEKNAHRRVVRLQNGAVLNRYWDDKANPRPEAHKEDIETAKEADRPATEVYRHLKAGAESGWDYSSRWLKDGKNLHTIHTTDIIPIDLNGLLHHLEKMLEKAYRAIGNGESATIYQQKSDFRRQAIKQFCWDEEAGFYSDYDFTNNTITKRWSLAGVTPLFFQISSGDLAEAVAKKVKEDFLQPGGVTSTLVNTGQQWDAPNGWAPLQWLTIQGLRNYGHTELADEIKKRWITLNTRVYQNTGKMVEKYNVYDLSLEAGGGEYPVQDGFGWSNGVLLRLMSEE